jgi:4-hydroxybenzoate polyprenyltransferase
MGWSAVSGGLDSPALFLYLGGIFWTLAYDTVYAHQDRDDDLRVGVKSSALKLGDFTIAGVSLFFLLSWVCLIIGVVGGRGADGLILMVPAGLHFFWQIARWDRHSAASSLSVFRSNRNAGFLILLACLL